MEPFRYSWPGLYECIIERGMAVGMRQNFLGLRREPHQPPLGTST